MPFTTGDNPEWEDVDILCELANPWELIIQIPTDAGSEHKFIAVPDEIRKEFLIREKNGSLWPYRFAPIKRDANAKVTFYRPVQAYLPHDEFTSFGNPDNN